MAYWEIGKNLSKKIDKAQKGENIIERLASDLKSEFPEIKGLSARNLWGMKRFFEAYKGNPKLQQLVAEIPWGHHFKIMEMLPKLEEREWYIRATIENGWSRSILVHQIESGAHKRHGKAISHFKKLLPKSQSELATETLKDPYCFDFLSLGQNAKERDLENALVEQIRNFLTELGVGFAFVGSQYHLEVASEDFYVDLLFYHIKLRCFIVIDLKMGEFKPEYAGKMNFYLTAVDKKLKHKTDKPSIGIILCKQNNKLIAEYALQDIRKPMGVSSYHIKLLEELPKNLEGKLPSMKDLEELKVH